MAEVKLTREPEAMHAGGDVAYRVTVDGRWIGWVGDARPWRGWRYGQRYWWACWREEGDKAARWNSGDLPTRKAAIQALLFEMEQGKGNQVNVDDVVNEAEKYSLMLWDSGTEFDNSETTRRIFFAKRDDADAFVSWLEDNGIQLRDEDRPDVWTVKVRLSRRCEAQATKGTCDRPLDELGQCDRASDHIEST